MNKTQALEALLFVAGEEGIALEQLAYLLEESTAEVYERIESLAKQFQMDENTAFHILEVGNSFLLTTKRELADLIKQYATTAASSQLSQASLETLAIVAYKQPITRGAVDELRGVNSASGIQKLVARQLIEEKGRVDGPGRPILYGTTAYFLDYFGLKSVMELPSVSEMEESLNEEEPLDLFFSRFQAQLAAFEQEAPNAVALGAETETIETTKNEE